MRGAGASISDRPAGDGLRMVAVAALAVAAVPAGTDVALAITDTTFGDRKAPIGSAHVAGERRIEGLEVGDHDQAAMLDKEPPGQCRLGSAGRTAQ